MRIKIVPIYRKIINCYECRYAAAIEKGSVGCKHPETKVKTIEDIWTIPEECPLDDAIKPSSHCGRALKGSNGKYARKKRENKMNNRQKGLQYVREVRRIMEKKGNIVEGPMYRPAFIKGKSRAVHSDFFGLFDLISYNPKNFDTFSFHQVSLNEKRSEKIKAILKAGVSGFFWGRGVNEIWGIGYFLYYIHPSFNYEDILNRVRFTPLKGN